MRRTLSMFTLVASLALAAPVLAQDPGDRATSFQAVSGSAHEDVPGGPLLVAAYAAVLVLLSAYVLRVAAMQAGATRGIERLDKMLADKMVADRALAERAAADAKKKD